MIVAIILSLVVGLFAGFYVTKHGYDVKLKSIAAEVRDAEMHELNAVRNFAARVKAFL